MYSDDEVYLNNNKLLQKKLKNIANSKTYYHRPTGNLENFGRLETYINENGNYVSRYVRNENASCNSKIIEKELKVRDNKYNFEKHQPIELVLLIYKKIFSMINKPTNEIDFSQISRNTKQLWHYNGKFDHYDLITNLQNEGLSDDFKNYYKVYIENKQNIIDGNFIINEEEYEKTKMSLSYLAKILNDMENEEDFSK